MEWQPIGTLDSRPDLRMLSSVHSVQISKKHLPGTLVQYFRIFHSQRHLKMATPTVLSEG
jgi:hypothetical protein